ncbi:6-phosphofructo-2-kinase [Conoideocrella luteorostrata]|uniref:6-phosphofructo-2-kinase n=1 Tax=Conoideocrella luteorostrata TaxID=1105319 RepID=A0AAJ0FWN4_9HYPO|nr:6-phosphofructo-2-kinase [Conoideocrella luteorostrata]
MPDLSSRLVIVMVGLPTRGKSFIVKKLARYLNWLQKSTRIFNAGELRRKAALASSEDTQSAPHSASPSSFFDPRIKENVSKRDEIALNVLNELIEWLKQDNSCVGILDATNSTRQRRRLILQRIRDLSGPDVPVLFLESCCSDPVVLERNFVLKLSSPDYSTQDPQHALNDFKQRVALYERAYTTISEDEEAENMSYVKIIDVGRKLNTHMIQGVLSSQVVEYMIGFNLTDRQIWLSCGGQSEDDAAGRIGRDSNLSASGKKYAEDLAKFVQDQNGAWHRETAGRPLSKLSIWTSTMPQASQTAEAFPDHIFKKTKQKMLDDINAGDMAGATFEEIRENFPEVYRARKQHKLLYRWPGLGGEAYADVIKRLRPMIVELERFKQHLLVISHRAIIRVLLSYFLDLQREDLPEMPIPEDTVFLLEPQPYGMIFQAFARDKKDRIFTEIDHAKKKFIGK